MSNKQFQALALHGFTGRGSDFEPFFPLCSCINAWQTPDLPGHGPDPQLDCSPEATFEQIDAQAGTANLLIAYSMGARAALQHAILKPEQWQALILISGNPGIESESERAERRQVDAKLAERIERDGAANFISFWQSTPMIRSQQNIRSDWLEAMQIARKDHTPEGLSASLRQFGQGSCPNLWPEIGKLTMPTLLVTGEEDLKYTRIAERMQTEMQKQGSPAIVERTVIQHSGHMPHLEAPEAVAQRIDDFLSRMKPILENK